MGLLGCGRPAQLDRSPDAAEVEHLLALTKGAEIGPWSTSGHALVESEQGRFEGKLNAILQPPERLKAELHSRALFGMVGEHVVVVLPGDGHVLTFRQREDSLERQALGDSEIGRFLPTGEASELQALVAGRPPWPRGEVPVNLPGCTRVLGTDESGRSLQVRVTDEASGCVLELKTRQGRLESVSWSRSGRPRVEVRYERWKSWDGMDLPSRLRLEIPEEGLRAEIDLDEAQVRQGLSERDFEVY